MNLFEKILYALQAEMTRPTPFGWFHLTWLALIIVCVVFLYKRRNNHGERQLKMVMGVYSIIAMILELTKQVVWSFNYDAASNIVTWDYQWYAAPFQLCTTPIYVCLICLFMKAGKTRKSLLSYVAYITIIGSIMTIILPDSCFTETIVVNIHTMWLHYGSFVVSVYLLMSGEVRLKSKNLKNAIRVFLMFVGIATILNIGVYHSGLLNDETFNMFYISPYFISSLPVFDQIQQSVPYVVYLLIYIVALMLGSTIVYYSARWIKFLLYVYLPKRTRIRVHIGKSLLHWRR